MKDSIVKSVLNKFKQRSKEGIKKYGVTLDRKDLSGLEWLNHLQEELMDATLYIERYKKDLEFLQTRPTSKLIQIAAVRWTLYLVTVIAIASLWPDVSSNFIYFSF